MDRSKMTASTGVLVGDGKISDHKDCTRQA